jgi:glutamyl-tRNA synthetase
MYEVRTLLEEKGITVSSDTLLEKVIGIIKDRCTLLPDFYEQGHFFFKAPDQPDISSVLAKWNEEKKNFFISYIAEADAIPDWETAFLEDSFKKLSAIVHIKTGELLLPFRIMLVGGKFGPAVFEIAEILGKKETIRRIENFLSIIP